MPRETALQQEKRNNRLLAQDLDGAKRYIEQQRQDIAQLRERITYLHRCATNLGAELVQARLAGGEIQTPGTYGTYTSLDGLRAVID